MDEKGVLEQSLMISSEPKGDSLCAMYFGVSCAFFALEFLSKPGFNDQNWIGIRDKMLQGSAHLLGLLIWRVQKEEANARENYHILRKLREAERETEELKRRRREDAKANERVASIYAAEKQNWLSEKKQMRQQIGSLLNELRVLEKKKDDVISQLNEKLREMEILVTSKEKELEGEEEKRKELEQKLKDMEKVVEEVRENAKREAQEHFSELLRHKNACFELVSGQRRLEAELGRALRQAEEAKKQLEFAFEEREESIFMVPKQMLRKLRRDSDEKQRVLARFSALDSALEVHELERNESRALRSMLSKQVSSRLEVSPPRTVSNSPLIRPLNSIRNKLEQNNVVLDYAGAEIRNEVDCGSPEYEPNSSEEFETFGHAMEVEDWVHSEAEKYRSAVEQRHQLELSALTEQMRLKDDKLEAYRWRLFSMELESKRLHSHVEVLNQNITRLRQDNLKLESMLVDRELELKSLKDHITLHLNSLNSHKMTDDIVWSNVKLMKKKRADKPTDKDPEPVKIESVYPDAMTERTSLGRSKEEEVGPKTEVLTSNHGVPATNEIVWSKVKLTKKKRADKPTNKDPESVTTKSVSQDTTTEETSTGHSEEDEVGLVHTDASSPMDTEMAGNRDQNAICFNTKDKSTWRIDLHALGVSYKIKRLKQQLVLLERITGINEHDESNKGMDDKRIRMKGLDQLMTLLNKQVSRYQSLQEKADKLCKRMHEKDLHLIRGESSSSRRKSDTKTLEHFLEETFQLQRFIVATGQKLLELQSLISSGFIGIAKEVPGSDMNRFTDNVKSLFRDVQRGLEVRVARVIGDLEGTLACDNIHFMK